jgi:hypothetical protein
MERDKKDQVEAAAQSQIAMAVAKAESKLGDQHRFADVEAEAAVAQQRRQHDAVATLSSDWQTKLAAAERSSKSALSAMAAKHVDARAEGEAQRSATIRLEGQVASLGKVIQALLERASLPSVRDTDSLAAAEDLQKQNTALTSQLVSAQEQISSLQDELDDSLRQQKTLCSGPPTTGALTPVDIEHFESTKAEQRSLAVERWKAAKHRVPAARRQQIIPSTWHNPDPLPSTYGVAAAEGGRVTRRCFLRSAAGRDGVVVAALQIGATAALGSREQWGGEAWLELVTAR